MSPRLRIAFLVDTFTVLTKGGRQAAGLSRAMIAAGHAVKGFGAPPGRLPSSTGDASEAEALGSDRGAGIVAFRPDVIVAWDALSPAAWLGARCARRLGVPLVLFEPGSYAKGSLFERTLWRLGETLWGRIVRSRAELLVATDPQARTQALEEGFAEERIEVLGPGVDVDRFRPGLGSPELARRAPGRVLLYVGRLETSRGVETLLAAFARTVGRGGGWSLVFAGAGDGRSHLRAMAGRLGVAASVHFLSPPEPEALPGLVSGATLVAVPASVPTVRGIQIPRAMACGCPVLASDLPRFRHLVSTEETGLLAPPGDVEAWTEALARATGSPTARRRWGDEARRRAEEVLAWPRVAARFEGYLRRALESVAPETERAAS